MNEWVPRGIIIGLLVLVVGVPFLLQPRTAADVAGGTDGRLIIYSPHNEQIRYEFSRGFNRWRIDQGKQPIEFDWRASGGTSDLRKQVLAAFEGKAADGQEDQGIGADLFFGGGEYEHYQLKKGIEVQRGGEEVAISTTVPMDLPAGLILEVFPDPLIGDAALYDRDLHWVGVAMSAFGIVYNNDALDTLGLPQPTTWSDLTDPRYRSWIALSDPAHSGSIAVTYEAIVRRMGWTRGWRTLREAFANARYFTSSSSKVPVDVSNGEAAAGMCIDFYGRFQAGAIGGDRVGYIDPAYMTAINADPISILRGAERPDLALEFVQWTLSEDAQRLWQRRLDAPDGPEQFELRRLPIRRDMYTPQEMSYWVDDVNPFAIASPFPEGVPNYYSSIGLLAHAIAIDVHDDLIAAWEAIHALPEGDPRRDEALALFHAMPPELTMTWPDAELEQRWEQVLDDPNHPRRPEVVAAINEFYDAAEAAAGGWRGNDNKTIDARLRWTLFFRDNYRRVVDLCE